MLCCGFSGTIRDRGLFAEIDLDANEVASLRDGGIEIPMSLRDKLGDAVHVREPGWYLVEKGEGDPHPVPRWWDGLRWRWGTDPASPTYETQDGISEPVRLHRYDEC